MPEPDRSVNHATFVAERTYEASPQRVFAAWADPEAKARWFGSPDQGVAEYELDFRVSGREFNRGTVEGQEYTYEARYQDIVPNERIVYAYDMHVGAQRISVSLGTVQLEPEGHGTRLTYTEQGAYLDGLDTAEQRQSGTGGLFDALAEELARQR
ncbi:MAG TPA: SRPBCC family protein [Solirubrobacterales bacterium]|nr:SRPBCC family protein [Solirubrobacterales bacterium]